MVTATSGRVKSILILLSVVFGAALLWALFWPTEVCDQPRCAKHRFTVGLEIDSLSATKPIDLEIDDGNESLSLRSIMRGGGIHVLPVVDDLELPFDPESGPLDAADLFQFASAWRDVHTVDGADAVLYALFVNGLIADSGEEMFGIMFDTADRQGFAVAPRTTERMFRKHESASLATLKLRTFAHELLHALNRHHLDAMQIQGGRLTLEAPTRCIAQTEPAREWTLLEPPLMALSPDTIRFFQTAAPQDILPGRENSPFVNRASATECDDARARVPEPRDRTRWARVVREMRTWVGISSVEAAEPEPSDESSSEAEEAPPPATITLQAQSAAYPLGYPVAIRVIVRNVGDEPLPIVDRLNPRYGMLHVEHRPIGEEEWRTLVPLTYLEPASDERALLAPGEQTDETIPVYFGEDGWSFAEPGDYELRVRLQMGEGDAGVASESIRVEVEAPRTADDQAALQPLLGQEGSLDPRIGQILYYGGRIGDRDDIEPLEAAAAEYGYTAVGAALQLTLLSHRLRRPIDPQTGIRPPPDFTEAGALLEETCTDSGVAAMTSNLLRRAEALPASIRDQFESDAAAWDGETPDGASLESYSDPELHRYGPAVHFCFNEAGLGRPVNSALRKVARQLRRAAPEKIVLVGHTDAVGSCRYNDSLALRRARAVRQTLIAAGIRKDAIEIASLGERRPLDFAWTPEAQARNRRVEMLVRGVPASETPEPLIPACPDRQ